MAKYVITGGPCVGKTTLCNELERLGHNVVPEAARAIIDEQQRVHGTLPWTDLHGFQELVLDRVNSLEAKVNGDAFCDRGALDGIAYCIEGGIPVTERLAALASSQWSSRRYERIYHLDPLPAYVCDAQRKESIERGAYLHALLHDVYTAAGYDVVRVPFAPIEERAQFILNDIQHNARSDRAAADRR